jgi:hypothetical protein
MRKISFAAGCAALILNYTKYAFVPMWLILTLLLVPIALTTILQTIGILLIAVTGIAQGDIKAPKAVQAFQMKRHQKELLKRREENTERAQFRAGYGRSTQQTIQERRNAATSR